MFLRLSKLRGDGRASNLIDKIFYRWTPLALVSITAGLFIYWLMGTPITCWAPQHVNTGQARYAESLCWTTATMYHIRKRQRPGHERPGDRRNDHYIWLPFLLLLMAVISTLPHWAWSIYIAGSNIKLDNLSSVFRNPRMEDKVRKNNDASGDGENQVGAERAGTKPLAAGETPHDGIYRKIYPYVMSLILPRHDITLVLSYMIVKAFNLYAISTMLSLLDNFSSQDDGRFTTTQILFHQFGFNTTDFTAAEIQPSTTFPDVVLCHFRVRVHRLSQIGYTLQCNMHVNYYSRVIIAIIGTWFMIVRVAAVVDLVTWVIRFLVSTAGTVLSDRFSGNRLKKSQMEYLELQQPSCSLNEPIDETSRL